MDLFRFPEQFTYGTHCRPHLREAMEKQGIVGRTCSGKKHHRPEAKGQCQYSAVQRRPVQ